MHCWWSPVELNQTKPFLSEGLHLRQGEGRELESNKGVMLWLINFTERVKMGSVGFDLILMDTGLVT